MKKILFTLILCGLASLTKAQNASVEQSTYGLQTGLLGIWVHSEFKLSNSIALRTELGLDYGIWGGESYDKTGFLMTPKITAEPRWYYNLIDRESRSKRIDGNSGNFVSLQASYRPDWFVISNTEDLSNISDISIIPTWGLRRNIGQRFNYEVGIGIGYRYTFAKQAGFLENESEAATNLHLRIGYRFK